MARGPFQGTYQPNARPTVATAPDALVYINGEAETIGCPQCSRTFNLNKYITSIQTDLSVDSSPGSASVQMSIPRHSIDDFYFDGNPIITTMMEIEIYAKGHYLVEGMPQYYPIFWGIVTEVSDSYSGGEHSVSVQAADILKWWEICKMNINPAFNIPSGQMGVSLFGNTFELLNPYDVIYTLANASFGDVLVGTGSTQNLVREANSPGTYTAALTDMMMYWERRFSRMRSNLVLYGTNGVAVRGLTVSQAYSRVPGASANKSFVATLVRNANGGRNSGPLTFDPADESVVAFKRDFGKSMGGLVQSEYQTKLELATAAKEAIGFEFFMDSTGDLVFKPPFYNLDVLGNKPVSWIQDIDVVDWDFSESESEVVTQIVMQGAYNGTAEMGIPAEVTPLTTVTDYHLLRKYGWRSQNLNAEFMTDPLKLFYHGLDTLDRINSRRHRGNVTIPVRPELRLGFPIYLAPKDQIWYVSGISHSIQFGGRATTTLQLTARRGKFVAPRGMGDLRLTEYQNEKGDSVKVDLANKEGKPKSFRFSALQLQQGALFQLDVGNAAEVPGAANAKSGEEDPNAPLIMRHPKTGRLVGYPNVVMAYSRPFSSDDIKQFSSFAGEKAGKNPQLSKEEQEKAKTNQEAEVQQRAERFGASKTSDLIGKHLNNTYQYGLNSAGVFVYAYDSSRVVRELLTINTTRVKVVPERNEQSVKAPVTVIRPVSDERGFEVIGHSQYGRRIALRDGRLITDNPDAKARVDVQLALSGSLSATLNAQAQGLTSIVTGYGDPAAALATMTDDDAQSAAAYAGVQSNPGRKDAEFTDVGDNFVGEAPLGSPEHQGIPQSVEATQLSRALTLAEMAVKDLDGVVEENCVCVSGRGDLAFMSSDYQVDILGGTAAPDFAALKPSIAEGPVDTGAQQVLIAKVDALEARVTAQRAAVAEYERGIAGQPENVDALTSMYLDAQESLDQFERELASAQRELEEARKQYTGARSILSSTRGEVTSRVEEFLTKLYKTLDAAHQEYEEELRGDRLPVTNADFSNLNSPAIDPASEFAPPFSAPNRFQLGDPNAAVGSAQSNVDSLGAAWSSFSKNLRSDGEKRALSTQISQDKASIARLTAARDQLIRQRDSATAVIGVDVEKQIDSLAAELAKLEQQVQQNQAKLSEA